MKFNKVFGIGLNKTGTSSLNKCLNILNINSIHYPIDEITYNELISANYNLSILKKYDAITDITASCFFKELDIAFPNSKFILTVRNINDWIVSIKRHIEKLSLNGKWIDYINNKYEPIYKQGKIFAKMTYFLHSICYKCLIFSEEIFKEKFNSHQKEVINYFNNTNKLLIINIEEDNKWEKICDFLETNIPNQIFPHENKYNK